MIKLIATDMDGTLLDSKKNFPNNFEEVLNNLKKNDIKFIVASGRQYFNLYKQFEEFNDEFLYICDNGGIIFDDKEIMYINQIDKSKIKKVIELSRTLENTSIILSGEKSAYVEDKDDLFIENARIYYERLDIVDDLMEFIDKDMDKICKIAVFHPADAEEYALPPFKHLEEEFLICVSGKHYIDLMNHGVNKGEALKRIQKYYNISFDETMAFGDYLNDYELLQSCKYSYAMENAHPKLKEVSNYIAKSNDENGVIKAIESHFCF